MLESGKRTLSDRTIKDICREYDINETWMKTGQGEMFVYQSLEEEIVSFTNKIVDYGSESFQSRFISAISKLDENGWAVLEKLAADMNAEKNDSE